MQTVAVTEWLLGDFDLLSGKRIQEAAAEGEKGFFWISAEQKESYLNLQQLMHQI